jgi:hypothetical protein
MAYVNYATALRCIGQDLDRRGLKSFDIRLRGEEYIAECGYQEPPSPTPVSITKATGRDTAGRGIYQSSSNFSDDRRLPR